jgi:hypothetical protein
MGLAALAANAVVLGLWLAATVSLVRRPWTGLQARSSIRRRVLVLVICLAGGVGGFWGPAVHQSTEVFVGPAAGENPARSVAQRVRTPVLLSSRMFEVSARGEEIREVRSRTFQVPLSLLAILAWAWWWRIRRRPAPGVASLRTPIAFLLLAAACGPEGELPDRGQRVLLDVTWDTLLVLESLPEDTVLFEATRVAADAHGIRVLDRLGQRVAMVAWDGTVLWYAGSRGGGPGELAHPRAVKVDEEGTAWVLDVQNHRITGFDLEGRLAGELPLHALDFVPHEFAVGPGAESFFLARPDGGIRPVEVRRNGTVRSGRNIRFPESRNAPPLALQWDLPSDPESGSWVVALSFGDGFVRFQGLDPQGGLVPWVEHVPLVRVEVNVEGRPGAGEYRRTQRVVDPIFASEGAAIMGSRLLICFGGRTENRGRLLDVYDMGDGRYRGSLLLPTGGWISAWDGRLVLARNSPHPRVLVLAPSSWP